MGDYRGIWDEPPKMAVAKVPDKLSTIKRKKKLMEKERGAASSNIKVTQG